MFYYKVLGRRNDLNVLLYLKQLYISTKNVGKAVDLIENKFLKSPFLKAFFDETNKTLGVNNVLNIKVTSDTEVNLKTREINLTILVHSLIFVADYYLNKGDIQKIIGFVTQDFFVSSPNS